MIETFKDTVFGATANKPKESFVHLFMNTDVNVAQVGKVVLTTPLGQCKMSGTL